MKEEDKNNFSGFCFRKEGIMENNGSVVPGDAAGIVTLSRSVMMMDGALYDFVWAARWKEVPKVKICNLRDPLAPRCAEDDIEYDSLVSEAFHGLVVVDGMDVLVAIPWEIVRGWVRCDEPPARKNIYCVKG